MWKERERERDACGLSRDEQMKSSAAASPNMRHSFGNLVPALQDVANEEEQERMRRELA